MSFRYIKVKTKGQIEGEKLLVPKLRFKEFHNKWIKLRLKDISNDISYGMNSAATDFDGINKYIRITDINEDTSLYNNSNPVSPSGYLDDKFLLQENDILFARTGASTGKTYLYNKDDGKLYFAGFLIRASIKKDYNSRFVFEQTKLNKYNNWVKIMSMRSGQPGINSTEYGNYEISITNSEEQEKIAKFVSLLDKKIELQQRRIEALKIYKRGLIQRIYNRTWNNKIKMEEILIQKSIRNTNDEIHNVYSVSNKDGFILQTEQFKDRIVASEDTRNYKVVVKNDFAYNPARINVGSIARMKQDIKGIISPMYICFKCNEKILPEYLEYFFESSKFTYEMSKRLEGSVRMCLSYESMLNIPIELPNKNEQEKISTFLNSLSNKIKLEEKKFTELNKLKKGLLQKMFI